MSTENDRTFDIALSLTKDLGHLATKFEHDSGEMKAELNKQTELLLSVQTQTIKTNGRVNKAEADIQGLKDINLFRKGRSAAIAAVVSTIITLALVVIGAVIKKYLGL